MRTITSAVNITMDKLNELKHWLSTQYGTKSLFLSLHFKTTPVNKESLCKRCRPIFTTLLRSILGRHWIKSYNRHFRFIGFQEFGIKHDRHIHFILNVNIDIPTEFIIEKLKTLSFRLNMDIWTDETEKIHTPKQHGDNLMIKQIYSERIFDYITKEIRIFIPNSPNHRIILDIDIIH